MRAFARQLSGRVYECFSAPPAPWSARCHPARARRGCGDRPQRARDLRHPAPLARENPPYSPLPPTASFLCSALHWVRASTSARLSTPSLDSPLDLLAFSPTSRRAPGPPDRRDVDPPRMAHRDPAAPRGLRAGRHGHQRSRRPHLPGARLLFLVLLFAGCSDCSLQLGKLQYLSSGH